MSINPIVRREFDDLIRSKAPWAFCVVLIAGWYLSLGGSKYIKQEMGADLTIAAFQTMIALLIPFAAILIGYRSVTGERESGSLKFTAAMPQGRETILLGKIIGRTMVLVVPMFVALTVGGLIGMILNGLFSPVVFVLFALASIIYTLVNVSVAVSISASVQRSAYAAVAVFGYLVIIVLTWGESIASNLYSLITGVPVNPAQPPAAESLVLVHRLDPRGAYYVVTNAIFAVGNSDRSYDAVIDQLKPGTTVLNTMVIEQMFDGSVPYYLHEWFAVVILGLWVGIPVTLGYLSFRRGDLGGSSERSLLERFSDVTQLHSAERYVEVVSTKLFRGRPLVRKEFDDLLRSKGLWLLSAILIGGSYLGMNPAPPIQREIGANSVVASFQSPVFYFVSVAAVLVGYRSITGERESGSLKFVAAMPQNRRDIVLEKIIGRTAAVAVPILFAFAVGAVIGLTYGLFSFVGFVLVVGASLLYALVNVSIATGLSASVKSSVLAAGGVFAYFILLVFLWSEVVANVLYREIFGNSLNVATASAPKAFLLLQRLGPGDAYEVLVNAILNVENSADNYALVITQILFPSRPPSAFVVSNEVTGSVPYYLHELFALVILVLWILIPVTIGILSFRRSDLS